MSEIDELKGHAGSLIRAGRRAAWPDLRAAHNAIPVEVRPVVKKHVKNAIGEAATAVVEEAFSILGEETGL